MEEKKEVKKTSVQIPTLETFLKAGAHFGHKPSAWNPKMEEYIYDERDGIHVIDIIKTIQCLKEALVQIENVVDYGSVLIVGTKGQAASVVEKVATESGALYINNRWAGGLFTNFEVIKKGLERLVKLEETLASGGQGHTKKEQLLMQREVDRSNRIYSGIKFMEKLPKLVIVIDSKVEKIAIKESAIVGVPVIALLDTNCDPTLVDYPIPANDDSIKSITLFLEILGQAVVRGKRSQLIQAMRKNYNAQLASTKRDYENKVATEKAMKEEERSRIKRLRVGMAEEKVEKSAKKVEKVEKIEKVEEIKKVEKVVEKETKKVAVKKAEKKITELNLDARAEKALLEAGIKTVSALKKMSKADLLALKGVGEKAAEKVLKSI